MTAESLAGARHCCWGGELWGQRPEDGAGCNTAQACRLPVCPQARTCPCAAGNSAVGTCGHSDSNKFQPSGDQPAPSSRLSCSRLRWWRDLGSPPPGPEATSPVQVASPAHGRLPKGQHGSDQATPAATHTWEGCSKPERLRSPGCPLFTGLFAHGGHSTTTW